MATPADNYIISRDTSEAQRLDIQHQYMISCQGYYLHPDIQLPSTPRIADVCTGSVAFLRDIAHANPSFECHGFDISDQMFPPAAELPPNVQLHVTDAKKPFDSQWRGYFDVVHVRLMEAAMTIDDWALVLRNLVTLLTSGGWIQWVEDDRAHSVRHAARPVAPTGAAQKSLSFMSSLSSTATTTGSQFVPPRLSHLDRFNRLLMPNDRADAMTYGYMNLDTLMRDPDVGGLEHVGCDLYVVDREDDGGEIRRGWAAMGIAAVWSMLKSREEAGDKVADVTRDELAEGFLKDIASDGHYVTRVSVFTGRKKMV